jgi:hypothetical protein
MDRGFPDSPCPRLWHQIPTDEQTTRSPIDGPPSDETALAPRIPDACGCRHSRFARGRSHLPLLPLHADGQPHGGAEPDADLRVHFLQPRQQARSLRGERHHRGNANPSAEWHRRGDEADRRKYGDEVVRQRQASRGFRLRLRNNGRFLSIRHGERLARPHSDPVDDRGEQRQHHLRVGGQPQSGRQCDPELLLHLSSDPWDRGRLAFARDRQLRHTHDGR